jgi:hypothetical protein
MRLAIKSVKYNVGMYSTVEKIAKNIYIIRVSVPAKGERFIAPEIGGHFIAEDGHFAIQSVEINQNNKMEFKVVGKKID